MMITNQSDFTKILLLILDDFSNLVIMKFNLNFKFTNFICLPGTYTIIFLASKLFNFALSLLFLRISDNFSTATE